MKSIASTISPNPGTQPSGYVACMCFHAFFCVATRRNEIMCIMENYVPKNHKNSNEDEDENVRVHCIGIDNHVKYAHVFASSVKIGQVPVPWEWYPERYCDHVV
mmetsp:Transcript_18056/g.41428  ORF Transcript_18056/g.41428 Transcript_18056/m.41428 type:complete len:104 (+) Transcript_18056:1590-1901(+)